MIFVERRLTDSGPRQRPGLVPVERAEQIPGVTDHDPADDRWRTVGPRSFTARTAKRTPASRPPRGPPAAHSPPGSRRSRSPRRRPWQSPGTAPWRLITITSAFLAPRRTQHASTTSRISIQHFADSFATRILASLHDGAPVRIRQRLTLDLANSSSGSAFADPRQAGLPRSAVHRAAASSTRRPGAGCTCPTLEVMASNDKLFPHQALSARSWKGETSACRPDR